MSLERLQLPEGYQPKLDIMETEIAIKLLKDTFERELANQLNGHYGNRNRHQTAEGYF